jgi:hypothetical protein
MAKFDGETEGKAVVEAFAKDVEGKTCCCRNAKEMVSELLDPLECRGIGYLPI